MHLLKHRVTEFENLSADRGVIASPPHVQPFCHQGGNVVDLFFGQEVHCHFVPVSSLPKRLYRSTRVAVVVVVIFPSFPGGVDPAEATSVEAFLRTFISRGWTRLWTESVFMRVG